MEKIRIKKLFDDAVIPTRGSNQAAGYDLYARFERNNGCLKIPAHETVMIGTGLAVEIPDGYFGGIFARSGLASKQGLRPANCTSVIDSDYRGELIVPLHNDSDFDKYVSNGDRIVQLVILPYLQVEFEEVNELNETDRGNSGFGSTGVN